MIFALNALFLGFVASIWSSSGWQNIFLKLVFVVITLVNCALAYPFVIKLVS